MTFGLNSNMILPDRHVLLAYPTLIEKIGRSATHFLCQLHYWLNQGKGGIDHEGERWIFNTQEDWAEQIKISVRQLRRILAKVMDQGLVKTQTLSPYKSNRTLYYTLNYTRLNDLMGSEKKSPKDTMSPSSGHHDRMIIEETKITNKNIIDNSIEKKSIENVQDSPGTEILLQGYGETFSEEVDLTPSLIRRLSDVYQHHFGGDLDRWKAYWKRIGTSDYLKGSTFKRSLWTFLTPSFIERIQAGDLGVKDPVYEDTSSNLSKSLSHIQTVDESPTCRKERHRILQEIGPDAYISWFTNLTLQENQGTFSLSSPSQFVLDRISQRFPDLFKES
jgi:hypothetical protein